MFVLIGKKLMKTFGKTKKTMRKTDRRFPMTRYWLSPALKAKPF
jgi:hypothetical protein